MITVWRTPAVMSRLGPLLGLLTATLLALSAATAVPTAPNIDSGRFHFPSSRDANNTTGNGTDLTPPTITILSHSDREAVKESGITLRGTASGNSSGVQTVQVRLNGGDWVTASGNTSWSVRLTLDEGWNTITVKAVDYDGNEANVTVALVLSSGTRDNSGIILAAAFIIPVILLVVLFATRKKRAPAEGEEAEEGGKGGEGGMTGGGTAAERKSGDEAAPEGEADRELADEEEVTHIEDTPVIKRVEKKRNPKK